MISRRKKLIYSAVLTLAGSLFAHELVRARSAEAMPVPRELPAEASLDAAADAAAPKDTDAAIVSSESSVQGAGARRAESVEQLLLSLEEALAGSREQSQIASGAPLGRRGHRPRQDHEEADEALSSANHYSNATANEPGAREPLVSRAQRAAQLAHLLREDPLLGLIRGEGEGVALFRSGAVRSGETWPTADAPVLGCEERGVRIEFKGEPAWIPLPALKTRARTASVGTEGGAPPAGPVRATGGVVPASAGALSAGGAQ